MRSQHIAELEDRGVNVVDSRVVDLAYGEQELEVIATGVTEERIEELGWNFRVFSDHGIVARKEL